MCVKYGYITLSLGEFFVQSLFHCSELSLKIYRMGPHCFLEMVIAAKQIFLADEVALFAEPHAVRTNLIKLDLLRPTAIRTKERYRVLGHLVCHPL